MTRTGCSSQAASRGRNALGAKVAKKPAKSLRQAQEAALLQPGVDARLEAAGLLALSAGLGTGILVGQRSPESATAVLEHHLNRVFRAGDA